MGCPHSDMTCGHVTWQAVCRCVSGSRRHGSTPMCQEVHPERGPAMAGQALSIASTHAHRYSTHCLWCRERTTRPCPQPVGTQAPTVC